MSANLHQQLGIPPQVQLLAVSKLQPNEKIIEINKKYGQVDFGENYVQEAKAKLIEFKEYNFRWHLIGPLQRNKVKDVVGFFHLIHSVDSLKLAQKIDQVATEKQLKQNLLLQINIANQDSKSGFSEAEFASDLKSLAALKNISIQGLMTMPPLTNTAEQNRPYFRRLKELLKPLQQQFPEAKFLSMGTTQDYKVAIEEGATHVRLGTLIFGERLIKY